MIIQLDRLVHSSDDIIINSVTDKLSSIDKDEIIYGTLVNEIYTEGFQERMYDTLYKILSKLGRLKQFRIIANEVNKTYRIKFHITPVYINYYALKNFAITSIDNQQINNSWNHQSTKFLFLTGKSNTEPNRTLLLSKFYDNKMLNSMEWSFFVNDHIIQDIKNKKWLDHYSQEEFDTFIKTCERNPDSIKFIFHKDSTHYGGFPFDPFLYRNTALSCVPETHFVYTYKGIPWSTEKSWKAIVNNHPFILISEAQLILKFKSLGFNTFNQYFKYQDYYIDNYTVDQKLDQVVENVKHFMSIKHKKVNEISKDVISNKKRFIDYVVPQWNEISQLIKSTGDTKTSTFDIIKEAGYDWL